MAAVMKDGMIMKYDKMVEITKELSLKKMNLAQKAISDMLEKNEKITVAELVRRTDLSRGFFYKNHTVRLQLDAAIRKQKTAIWFHDKVTDEQKNETAVINLRREVLKEKIANEDLMAQIQDYAKENQKLREKIEKLEEQVKRKEISFLKKL